MSSAKPNQTSELETVLRPSSPWRSRGYLPHFDRPGLVQSLTFRLADSLPRSFLEQCERQLRALPESERRVQKDKRITAYLDRGEGAFKIGLKPDLRPSGSIAQVVHQVEYISANRMQATTSVIMPPMVTAPDTMSLLPQSARNILMRRVQE